MSGWRGLQSPRFNACTPTVWLTKLGFHSQRPCYLVRTPLLTGVVIRQPSKPEPLIVSWEREKCEGVAESRGFVRLFSGAAAWVCSPTCLTRSREVAISGAALIKVRGPGSLSSRGLFFSHSCAATFSAGVASLPVLQRWAVALPTARAASSALLLTSAWAAAFR